MNVFSLFTPRTDARDWRNASVGRRSAWPVLLALAVATANAPLHGQDAEAIGDLLEEALLEDLETETFGKRDDRADDKGGTADGKGPADGKGVDRKQGAQPGDAANDASSATDGGGDPLSSIAARMRQVERRIGDGDTAGETQQEQERIVADLGALIDELRKRQRQQKPGSGRPSPGSQRSKVRQPGNTAKTGNKPARDSTDRLGSEETGEVDMAEMEQLLKDLWGHLPPAAREQIMQSARERFVPKYEVLIEQYFRRLAAERPPAPRP